MMFMTVICIIILLILAFRTNWRKSFVGRVVSMFAVLWLVWCATMTFAVNLVPSNVRMGRAYRLPKNEIAKINAETAGMDAKQIVDYAMDYTCENLDFQLKKGPKLMPGEGNCITYAAMYTAVANQGFKNAKIDARARHDAGTIKLFGIDLCKLGGNLYDGFFSDHDFVTITTSGGSYSIDPSFKDVLGYDLKTKQK